MKENSKSNTQNKLYRAEVQQRIFHSLYSIYCILFTIFDFPDIIGGM